MLVSIIVTLVVLGLVFYLIDRYIPMAEPFKTILNVVVVFIFIVYLLRLIGVSIPLHL